MRREFPVSNAGIRAAFDFVAEAVGAGGGDAAVAGRVSVVLDEVCANLIRHDTSLGESARFSVELTPGPAGTRLVICDPGRPFNPLEHRPDRPAGVGGKGLELIRGLARDARYERVGDCNRLTVSIPAGGGRA